MVRGNGRLLAVAAITSVVLTACGDGGESGSDGGEGGKDAVKLAFFNPIAANAYTAAAEGGVEAAAEELGADVTSFDAGFDQAKQISQMQDAIATGEYDAFLVMPVNGASLVDVTAQAIDAGIEVVAVWNNIGPDLASIEPQVEGLASVVAQSMGSQGNLIGEETAKACEGVDPCTVVYMPGSFLQGSEKLRLDAFTEVTDQYSNIEVKTSADGGYQAGPAEAAAKDVLLAMPEIDVFVTPGDQMTIGIVKAIDDAGKAGDIAIVSAGATKEGIQLVRDGVVMSDIVVLPESEGRMSATYAIKAALGEDVPASVDSSTFSPIGPVATAETLGTPEGEDFLGEYSG